jgi:hypothetical protein
VQAKFESSSPATSRQHDNVSKRVRTLSDTAARLWRLRVGHEFTHGPDDLTGLVQTCGLKIQDEPVVKAASDVAREFLGSGSQYVVVSTWK